MPRYSCCEVRVTSQSDVISDSNLRGSLGNNSVLSQFIQFLENEQDYIYFMSKTNCSLDFVTYVKSDGTVAGNKIKYRENHRSDRKSINYMYISEGSKYAAYTKINGVKMVDVRVNKQSRYIKQNGYRWLPSIYRH